MNRLLSNLYLYNYKQNIISEIMVNMNCYTFISSFTCVSSRHSRCLIFIK